MKKILLAYGVLVLVVVILAVAKFRGFDFLPQIGNTGTATIGSKEYKLLVADNEKERQVGLSNRKSLDPNTGMLFKFDKPGKYGFWMKNTLIPLDIIYIRDNKIVHIVKNAPAQGGKTSPLPVYMPPTEANYVLEINGGQSDANKLKVGDSIVFEGVQ